jgi:CheY-like chemotaxis protein
MGRKARVLIVDDFEDAREIYASYLGALGYACDVAADGAEAPTASSAVIVLTGQVAPGPEARRRAEDAGVVAFLTKPCLPRELAHVIAKTLGRGVH